MTKKRKTRKKTKKKVNFWQRYKKLFYILIVAALAVFLIYSGFDTVKTLFKEKRSEKKVYPSKELLDKINKMLKEERKKVDILKKELNKAKKKKKSDTVIKKQKNTKTVSSEAMDYKKSLQSYKNIEPKKSNSTIFIKSKKPLLAIIIDDVSFASEVKKIKALPFKVTPSFFPPTKRHPDTPKLAREFDFYMVHLPLEALHYPHPEPKTLLTTDTQETITNRIKNVRAWFPRDKFLNNHTGSKFTSDYNSMVKLFNALQKYHIVFIDSRTSAATVAKKVAKQFHEKLLSRDIFLDNKANISYIQNQLKKAVKKAKTKGFAIAIGHPHPKTLQALKISKNLFKDVKLVYISTIYENIKTNSK